MDPRIRGLIGRGLLTPTLTCTLPGWVANLLPEPPLRDKLLRAAAIRGTKRDKKDILLGQGAFETEGSIIVVLKFDSLEQLYGLLELGNWLLLTYPATILRTAIMLGLNLPHVEKGVVTCTRTEPLTKEEIENILMEGY